MRRLPQALAAALVCLMTAACTSGPSDGDPTPTNKTTSTAAVTTAPPTSTPPTTSAAPSGNETKDRLAVEMTWKNYWGTYLAVKGQNAGEPSSWPAALKPVAVDPIYTDVLTSAALFKKDGIASYGTVTFHTSWAKAINGGKTAEMLDCQDQSQYGSLFVETGKKRTVGVKNNLIRAFFQLQTDGTWRVQQVAYVKGDSCTA